ncbi:hypothetical protein KQI88_16350 [Alkaliphilus sp. MSJ-5]|uniref:Uncharacterized protein n=1 Tax=Alkaliphilus flagellatus TaxID=2841507 RepID=A0ABS6G6A3_9FIRM|nr:hypothetical protein [Alkaliphilus flagellatus]MBU5677991.1 hypothetical protein [Alkaliphilus flagellatus]
MENNKDKEHVIDQMNQLKMHNDKIKECLSAIQLLMVDNNNSRIKDESVTNELDNLSKQVNSISTSINTIERSLS